jgi:hypothetical protein
MTAEGWARLLSTLGVCASVAACSSSPTSAASAETSDASSSAGGRTATSSTGGGRDASSSTNTGAGGPAGGGATGGGATGGGATGGGGGAGGAADPDACDESQMSDIPGVTRQCAGAVFDDFSCDTGLDPCGFDGPLTELFNVYGLTPWYGEYAGQVTMDANGVEPVNPGSDFFGAKYALGEGMNYEGATETVCLDDTSKYVALRFVPNTASTIHLVANASFELVRTLSVSTQPGQFNDGNPAVVCKTTAGGSAALELSTNGTTGAMCALEIGKSYWINYYDGGAFGNPQDPHCSHGYGGSFSYNIVN